jgi:hypothetical protein
MGNIIAILTLLLGPYWALTLVHAPEPLRGRVGIALVFAFTGVGHFIKTSAMARMLPDWVPHRFPVVYLSGVFELLAAAAILIPLASRPCWYRAVRFPDPGFTFQRICRVSAC